MTYEEAVKIIKSLQFDDDDVAIALQYAIKAVEKQIPKKPKIEQQKFNDLLRCPACDKALIHRDETGFFAGTRDRYCSCCGQALDWRKENEK